MSADETWAAVPKSIQQPAAQVGQRAVELGALQPGLHAPNRPRRIQGVLQCDVMDELLVYVPAGARVVALNTSARAIWELCEGQQSLAEIAASLGRRFGVPAEALLPDVRQAAAQLFAFGLLEPAGG